MIRLTARLDITKDVDLDVKPQIKQTNHHSKGMNGLSCVQDENLG